MISPYQAGIKNIVAVKGTAFTENQLRLLHRFCDSLILALDSDFAGNTAALRSIELADSLDFDIKVLDLSPRFKDPDEAVNKDLEFFKTRLQKVLPVWDFVINSAVKQFGTDSPRGKKQVLALCLPFISKINNAVIRSDYLKKLANTLDSDINAVDQESKKYSQTTKTENIAPISLSEKNTIEEKLEEKLFTLILYAKKPHLVAQKISQKYEFIFPRFQNLLKLLVKEKKYHPSSFQAKLSPEIMAVFQNIYLEALNLDFDSFRVNGEIKKIINQLQIQKIKSELKQLSEQIAATEDNDQNNTSKMLEIRYNKLLVNLSKLQCQHP